jgi:hypothetical protein
MSRAHGASRRRSYAARQHDVRQRKAPRPSYERAWGGWGGLDPATSDDDPTLLSHPSAGMDATGDGSAPQAGSS